MQIAAAFLGMVFNAKTAKAAPTETCAIFVISAP
jgi:hypothetical protein